jgi:glycosyltransferase involved in cell wall biosynthesis
MQSKVAILISVYNTEEYLYQCLTSAINQTLQEIEIIVVNDASIDSSLEIIQEIQKKR